MNNQIWWEEKRCFGFKKCPNWLKKAYLKAVENKCQECHFPADIVGNLTPHRIIRGNQGGLYTVALLTSKSNNIKVVCNRCHKKLHGKEFL